MNGVIDLPDPHHGGVMTLEHVIRERRTRRDYAAGPLTLAELSQLLWSAAGVTSGAGQRATPSASGQYPLHLYVVAGAITTVPVGLYAYHGQDHGQDHALTRVSDDDRRPALDDAAIGDQPWIRDAATIIVVTADMPSLIAHFASQPGELGARYAWIETGALTQNMHLQATSLGLGAVLVGGFDDARVQAAVPECTFQPTALLCVGRCKDAPWP